MRPFRTPEPINPTPQPLSGLEVAIKLATEAHAGQLYGSEPYIFHPIRVAADPSLSGDEIAQVVAVLHDTIEDTWVTPEYLFGLGFNEQVVSPLVTLTHRVSEPYADYIKRVATNPMARLVKIADMTDNMRNLDRIALVDVERALRLERKYLAAHHYLTY